MAFDTNSTPTGDSGIFGLPFTEAESRLQLIPVPWEVTTSYGEGASRGPEAILRASHQVDLFDIETGDVYRNGYYMLPIPEDILSWKERLKAKARIRTEAIEDGRQNEPEFERILSEINETSGQVNE